MKIQAFLSTLHLERIDNFYIRFADGCYFVPARPDLVNFGVVKEEA
jgi:hypothetical protein